MLSAWHSSGWQQNNAIPGRVSGSPTASDMAVSAMPVGTLGIHNLGLSATQQGAAAVEARVFHLLFCDGFTYYTAAPSFPKSCKVQYGMVFFWKLWQEMMHWSCLSRLICRSWFCHYIWQTASMVELFRWIEQSWYSACKTHANTLCSSTTCSGVSSVGTLSPLNLRAVEEILGGVKSPLMQQWMCFSSQACRSPFSASGVYDKFIREVFWRREARTSCGDQRGSYGGAAAFPEQTYKIFYNSGVYHC